MKPERLYAIIFDAVYGSLTLSSLLFTLYIYNKLKLLLNACPVYVYKIRIKILHAFS